MQPISTLRVLLDRDPLAVAGVLALAPATTDDIVDATGLDRRTVLTIVGSLRSAGLVAPDGSGYALADEALESAYTALGEAEVPMDPAIGYGMSDDEHTVLTRYFSGRTLVELPSGRAARLIVLERIALEFDVGTRYDEDEVNAILLPFHGDHAMLRRYLVDECFLDREHVDGGSLYWRRGGRVI